MRIIIQRVKFAEVLVGDRSVARIDKGLFLLLGFSNNDKEIYKSPLWFKIIKKIPELRIFSDDDGKFNLSLMDVDGEILVVSQFTLYGDMKKGKRPSFTNSSPYKEAKELYNAFIKDLEEIMPGRVKQGIFGANMDINLCNFGPVTLILDSDYM
ncbi:D-aminoacyl-tRNA deacylase [Desulfothermus sp.]